MENNAIPWYASDDSDGFRLAELAAHALVAHHGEHVVVLDLRGRSDVADFFVVATGTSDVQVGALAEGVEDELRAAGQKPANVEGKDRKQWILLDYFDVIVHVQLESSRRFYDLERLWNDAGRLDVAEDYFAGARVAERHPDLKLVRLAHAGDETGTEEPA